MADVLVPESTDIADIVGQVWSSFLGEEKPLLPTYDDSGSVFGADRAWSATVSITGGWDATVTLEISERVALDLTRLMLGADLDDADDAGDGDDGLVADAVGELVNMIGGNVKALMPGPSVLSLPVVAAGRAAHPSGAVEVSRLDRTWAGEAVRVRVHVLPTPPLP